MERFLEKHPFAFGIIIFLIVSVGGSIGGILLGVFMLRQPCSPVSPSDPCDGAAMLAVALWTLSIPASLIMGIIATR